MDRKRIIVPLAAFMLLAAGCPPQGIGGGGTLGTAFKIVFNPVTDVQGIAVDPPSPVVVSPTTSLDSITIEGTGTLEASIAVTTNADGTTTGNAISSTGRADISLSYPLSTDDLGCEALAREAQQQGRTLLVEGIGTVVVAPIPFDSIEFCPASGGSASGAVDSCPTNADGTTMCAPPPLIPCQPPLPRYVVNADQLTGCTLGDPVALPSPSPSPSPIGL